MQLVLGQTVETKYMPTCSLALAFYYATAICSQHVIHQLDHRHSQTTK